MNKILMITSILFGLNSMAGTKGATDLWPNFKNECEASGGYASPVPKQCAGFAAAATQNTNITYTSLPDGNSPNSKCCVKCKGELMSLGTDLVAAERKCGNALGAVWIPFSPPKAPGCCFKPSTSSTATEVSTSVAVAVRRYCPTPMVFVTSTDISPVPLTQAACTSAGYTWGMNACCKNP